MPFPKVKWITIDAGGTLLFPHPSVGAIYAEVLARHGLERDPALLEEWFLRVWKKEVQICPPQITAESEKERWRGVISRTFAEISHLLDLQSLFDDLWVTFREASRWRVPERTVETLTELRARNYRLAVLSNWDERLRPLLQGIGLESYFQEIFVSCELGFEKPDPRLFKMVQTRLGVTGPEILHIGDSHHHDVAGATSFGWRAVQAFADAHPERPCTRIACFSELLAFLPSRNGS